MCNTSIYQQKRRFNKLASERGMVVAGFNQMSPRKFELILTDTGSSEVYLRKEIYDFLFCDDGVKYRRIK